MEHPFEEDEIKRVVWSTDDNKAPGPNHFTMAFFKSCWDVVKGDLMDTNRNFHEETFLDLGSNATFLSLILKHEHANKVSNFRTISLVPGGQCIKSSLNLSYRLKVALQDVISSNQSAFLVAEAFGALLSKDFESGLLEGFKVGNNGLMIYHLQFTDDTLILCKDLKDQVLNLRCVIRCFEAVSGLKVNLHKSRMYGVDCVENIERLAECLDCSVDFLPTTYLGLPLSASFKKSSAWNHVISRIHKRLVGWKGSFLSKGGNIMLINSVLASLPTYYLSLLSILMFVEKKIE